MKIVSNLRASNLVHHDESELNRKLCWDEENRLTTVKDGDYMSAYLYDHAGERVWKMTGEVQSMTISGQTVIDYVALDRKTLYTNPYLIVTEAEYTKHYYAESQRIASKLGGGWANALVDPLNDHLPETPNFYYNELNSKLEVGLGKRAECVGMDPNYVFVQDGFTAIDDQYGVSDPEINQYFYHPDHLGSSSFITNASGNVDQHLQYLPFGEPWIDQRTQNNIRFTFSGKERDDETGYNYFGARYYNADISIWLSVDPMTSERAWLTPYNYVQNNPIKLVDPTGMLDELSNTNGEEKAVGAINPLASGRSNYLSTLVRSNSPYANNGSNSNQNPFNEGRNTQIPIVTSSNPFNQSGINFGGNSPSLSDFGTGLSLAGEGMWLLGENRSTSLFQQGFRRGLSGNYQLTGRNLSLFGNQPMTSATKPLTNLNTIGNFGKVLSNTGTFLSGASAVVDTYSYSQGNLSGARYSYHMIGTGSSLAAMSYLGGPYGAAVGGLFFLGEKTWDMTQPIRDEISRQYWQFENALRSGWRPR